MTTDGSISSNYEKQTDLTLVFAKDYGDKWTYIEDIAIGTDPGILWPAKVSTAAGSGTGVKAGCYIQPRSSGVRAAWCFCNLNNNGNAGLAARNSNNGTTNSNWNAAVGAPSGYLHLVCEKYQCIIYSALMCENCQKPAPPVTAPVNRR